MRWTEREGKTPNNIDELVGYLIDSVSDVFRPEDLSGFTRDHLRYRLESWIDHYLEDEAVAQARANAGFAEHWDND